MPKLSAFLTTFRESTYCTPPQKNDNTDSQSMGWLFHLVKWRFFKFERFFFQIFVEGMYKYLNLGKEIVERIFPCIDQLIDIHFRLLEELRIRQNEQPVMSTLADILLKQFSGLSYFWNYSFTIEEVKCYLVLEGQLNYLNRNGFLLKSYCKSISGIIDFAKPLKICIWTILLMISGILNFFHKHETNLSFNIYYWHLRYVMLCLTLERN